MRGWIICLLLASPRRGFIDDEYYRELEVPRNATSAAIKTSFRRLSRVYHPDLNRDPEAGKRFSRITEAYDVLNDEDKRRKYDRHGKEGLKEGGGGGGGDPFDIFSFFGGGRRSREEEEKAPPLLARLHVSLEDVYSGREIPVTVFKRSTCFHCRGSGGDTPEAVSACPVCKGRGVHVRTVQVAPGFYQQMQGPCPKCGGRGKIITQQCHVCRGEKLIDDMETFIFAIERGAAYGSHVTLRNAGDDYADKAPADVVFELRERAHPFYTRRGAHDLQARVTLTLQEALLGFAKKLRHLDGRGVPLSCGGVTQPGHVAVVAGEGLPRPGSGGDFGDLFVEYRVDLPAELSPAQQEQLRAFFRA